MRVWVSSERESETRSRPRCGWPASPDTEDDLADLPYGDDFLGTSNRDTPLDRACAYTLIPLIRFLLANGAAWDRVTRIGVTLVSYVRGRRKRYGGRDLNQIFDEFLTKYWMLRLRLRVIGRRSVAQQRVLGDLYLSAHLASFVIGDGVLSSRPAS